MLADPDATTAAAAEAEAWHSALQASMHAQRDFRANNGNPDWDSDWDDEAEAMLEAAWPHIARYEHAEARASRPSAESEFLGASVAVWREIDRLDAEPGGYHPIRMSVELRQRERAAWNAYRDLLGGDTTP